VIELKVSRGLENEKLEEIFLKHVDTVHLVKKHIAHHTKSITMIGEKKTHNSREKLMFVMSSFFDSVEEHLVFGRFGVEKNILDIRAGETEAIEEEILKEVQNHAASVGGIVISKHESQSS
jgi:hypothetical protein